MCFLFIFIPQKYSRKIANYWTGLHTGVVFDVDVGAVLDEFLHLLAVAANRRHVQRRLAALVALVQLLVGGGGSRCPPPDRQRRQRTRRRAVRLPV